MTSFEQTLNPKDAQIFRITHVDNLRWICQNGIHCRSSSIRDPDFITIGSAELIEKRRSRSVPIPPGGTLEDYVAFYFTPFSPMLYNIKTGVGGVTRRENQDIAILVSSLRQLEKCGVPYVFTDRHAYLRTADFFSDPTQLSKVDYKLLRERDFARDADDPGKFERYQAEALAHGCVPIEALIGIACYTSQIKERVNALAEEIGVTVSNLAVRPEMYFS